MVLTWGGGRLVGGGGVAGRLAPPRVVGVQGLGVRCFSVDCFLGGGGGGELKVGWVGGVVPPKPLHEPKQSKA